MRESPAPEAETGLVTSGSPAGPEDGPATEPSATIYDVARAAGVGRQTVSNVLNNGGRVGAAARERVLSAVEALGYQPHRGARSLRSRRTMQLAYLMPPAALQPGSLIMIQFLQGLVGAAARHDYSIVVAAADDDPLESMRRLIASHSVDGFVLSDLRAGDPRVELLAGRRMPFAGFGQIRDGLPQHWVDIDNRAALALAAEHVLDQGLTRLAYVGYPPVQAWDRDRADGFAEALARRGVAAVSPPLLIDDEAAASARIGALIDATAPSAADPVAVVAGSDKLAAVVYAVAAERGLRVGADLAVTGFDGSLLAGLLSPPLTTVAIPVAQIAERVIDRTLHQIRHGRGSEPGELLAARLVPGAST